VSIDALFEEAIARTYLVMRDAAKAEHHFRQAWSLGLETAPEQIVRTRLATGDPNSLRAAVTEFLEPLGPARALAYTAAADALEDRPPADLHEVLASSSLLPRLVGDVLQAQILLAVGDKDKGQECLERFFGSGRSQREPQIEDLAHRLMQRLRPTIRCCACLEDRPLHHVYGGRGEVRPVCEICHNLLEDSNTARKYWAKELRPPDAEAFRNFYGNMVSMTKPRPRLSYNDIVAPLRTAFELLTLADAHVLKAVELARALFDKAVTSHDLVFSLAQDKECHGAFRDIFGQAPDQWRQADWRHIKVDMRESRSDMKQFSNEAEWALNVAAWIGIGKGSESITPSTLLQALFIRRSVARNQPELLSDLLENVALCKVSAPQRDYFVKCLDERPDCLFLRTILVAWGFGRCSEDTNWTARKHASWFVSKWPNLRSRVSHTVRSSWTAIPMAIWRFYVSGRSKFEDTHRISRFLTMQPNTLPSITND
jgi:hypothetical protein